MSRSEVPEVDETEDRPAIGAARLEAMFDGLRREVVLGVPVPESTEVARRGARRKRRRRAGAVAGAGVLGGAVLWTAVAVVPLQGGHGAAGVPVEQSALPRPKETVTLALPLPPLPSASGSASTSASAGASVPAGELLSLASAEPEVRALALGAARMPSVLGGYGPWTAVSPSASAAGASPSWSAPASASTSASASTPVSASGPSRSAPAPASASASAQWGAGLREGCVSGLVASAGAVRVWGEAYTDGGDLAASAHQYVLGFRTVADAEVAGARLLAGGECVGSGAGWAVEERSVGVAALGLWQPSVRAEEVAVHVRGSMVAVLTVCRGGRGVVPEVGLSQAFRVSAAEFLSLGEPVAGTETPVVPVG
ncbi:hypothetical protein K353_05474 [Kitasatospora sp. SolWspMP-SS2h]|uniref:hypothetical protein n=1 Tax=Kitasatospora sp. SolWspMP-SS2h TaxID=1305729 RepID=UPI000DBFDBB9|nr:hypothetical protein [Kitasatospora sp. SolWspMP-SS2h]RAJ34507.1 hypothetical protein K353_05474 [Kitasatospora sp. SolWspMP-SS2h]